MRKLGLISVLFMLAASFIVAPVSPVGAQDGSDCVFIVANVEIVVPPGGEVMMGEMTLRCPSDGSTETLTPAAEETDPAVDVVDPWEAIEGLPTDCPSDGEMQEMFGFDEMGIKPIRTGDESIPWEPCKWSLQANEQHVFNDVLFLRGWQLTYTDRESAPVVSYGDGSSRDLMGATIRYLPTYSVSDASVWVMDPAELLAREVRFGLTQEPAYLTCQ